MHKSNRDQHNCFRIIFSLLLMCHHNAVIDKKTHGRSTHYLSFLCLSILLPQPLSILAQPHSEFPSSSKSEYHWIGWWLQPQATH